jgi:beige protein homolog 1
VLDSQVSWDVRNTLFGKRITRLKKLNKKFNRDSEAMILYEKKKILWIQKIQNSEANKIIRYNRDIIAAEVYFKSEIMKIISDMTHERACWGIANVNPRWKLDFTETRSRMRKKMTLNIEAPVHYMSKSEKTVIFDLK